MKLFSKKEKIEVEKLTPIKIKPGINDYYITKKLQLKNGLVNIAMKGLNNQIDFTGGGKVIYTFTNKQIEHFGMVELEYLYFNPKMLKEGIPTVKEIKDMAPQSNLNENTSKDLFYSLFNVLLDKFNNEIYVILEGYDGCYTFDRNKKYQGFYTFYNTGFGLKNCQVPIAFYTDVIKDRQRIKLKDKRNKLNMAQEFYDAPTRRLEGAKLELQLCEQEIESENKSFNDKWGYLK